MAQVNLSAKMSQLDLSVSIYRTHIWTFTRSTTPLGTYTPLEDEGLVLKASWKHGTSYFQLWEPEVPDVTKIASYDYHRDFFNSFYETKNGAPFVRIYPTGPAHCTEALITKEPTIVDWVTMRNPTTFQVPKVIYTTERCGFNCHVVTQLPGRSLESVLTDVLGLDDRGFIREAAPTSPEAAEVRRICAHVSPQVADAVMEMSTWRAHKCAFATTSVDGCPPSDHNLYENIRPIPIKGELLENLQLAGLDWKNTICSLGDVSPENIILDEKNNFVGSNKLYQTNFVPRGWISVTMIDPMASKEANIAVYSMASLRGPVVPRDGPDSVFLIWPNLLWEQLAVHDGFVKVDPHRLPWLRKRRLDMERANLRWRELDEMMKEQGKTSWEELVIETKPARG